MKTSSNGAEKAPSTKRQSKTKQELYSYLQDYLTSRYCRDEYEREVAQEMLNDFDAVYSCFQTGRLSSDRLWENVLTTIVDMAKCRRED